MLIEKRAVAALRVFLVVLFGILVVFQTLSLPGKFAYMAKESPQDAHLRWPATIVSGLLVLCVQVIVVSTWKLLSLVKNDRIFSDSSMKWVNAIVWSIAAFWLVVVAAFLYVVLHADDPGLPMVLFLLTTGITVLGLLMIVMRALLRRATTLQTELQGVI